MKRALLAAAVLALAAVPPLAAQQGVTRYVRYAMAGDTAWGVVEGATIHVLDGDPVHGARRTGATHALDHVKLLAPVNPGKVIAVGRNYVSHLGDREAATYPGLFAKYASSLVGPGDDIVRPPESKNLHYEGELVLVISRRAHHVPASRALDYIFGATAGNDVSERDWQAADMQWFRAKASDTFGPVGPFLVSGLDYGDLLVETRLNGEVRQSQRTTDLIFDIPTIISYVSRYVTLEPGDIIFTGTPGSTRAMEPGDVVEIEVEGVGILRNTVRQGG